MGTAGPRKRVFGVAADNQTAELKTWPFGRAGSTVAALRKAIELAGVEFIDENGGGAGVRLRKRQKKKG